MSKTVKLDRFAVLVALVTAAMVLASSVWTPAGMQVTKFVEGTLDRVFLCIGTLGALPLAFAMPRLRASFYGRMWRVPSSTYVLPRWIVRFGIGGTFGQVVGFFVLAIAQDHSIFWLVGSTALVCGAFCAGAWPRLKKDPRAEFTMRWWPRM